MASDFKQADYTTVTEVPGGRASKEQIKRMYQRYRFASDFCQGKDVLEVACGSGQGLGLLVKKAKRVVGGDIDENNLQFARDYYKDRQGVELKVIDAQDMPFDDKSFDVVILYEAIYYLKSPESFVREASRILRDSGVIIICTANKDWVDFNPSPYSHKYFSVPEFKKLLGDEFRQVNFYGGFKVEPNGLSDDITSFIKQMAVKFHLMPKTMKGKEFFKRLFFGKLCPLPAEITEGLEEYAEPEPIGDDRSNGSYKVIYAVGWKEK
jgi:ubiquinone/menaquinone biosynthesis C-methylase UbiE